MSDGDRRKSSFKNGLCSELLVTFDVTDIVPLIVSAFLLSHSIRSFTTWEVEPAPVSFSALNCSRTIHKLKNIHFYVDLMDRCSDLAQVTDKSYDHRLQKWAAVHKRARLFTWRPDMWPKKGRFLRLLQWETEEKQQETVQNWKQPPVHCNYDTARPKCGIRWNNYGGAAAQKSALCPQEPHGREESDRAELF